MKCHGEYANVLKQNKTKCAEKRKKARKECNCQRKDKDPKCKIKKKKRRKKPQGTGKFITMISPQRIIIQELKDKRMNNKN